VKNVERLSKLIALAIAVSLVGAGSVSAVSSSFKSSVVGSRSAAKCPAVTAPPLYGGLDEVVAAARRILIRGSVELQQGTVKLTKKNSRIHAVVSLTRTGGTPFPGLNALRAAAAKRCGAGTMEASWAVKIGRPSMLASTSARTAFLVKTKSGWKTY